MGKATVISHLGGAQYQVQINLDRTRIIAALALIDDRVADLETRIAALEDGTEKNWLTLQKIALEKRKALLEDRNTDPVVSAWCADLTTNLSGDVGTIFNAGTTEVINYIRGADVFDEDGWTLSEIGEGDEPLRSILEDALEKLEEKYDTFCGLIAKAEGIHDFFVEGCGLEGDWDGMSAKEKITALEDALIECDRHATYYDSMYEYVQGADISHYRCSTAEDDPDEIMVTEFCPADDPDFAIDPDHTIEFDTVRYVPVCWGEDGLSLLREDALEEVCFVRYMYNPLTHEYVSDGRAYKTREQAEQSA